MFPLRSFIFEEGKIEQTHCSDSHVEMWFLWFCLHTEKAVGGAHSEGSWGKKASTSKNEKVVIVGSNKALQMLNLQNHFCYKKQFEGTYCNNSQQAVGCEHSESSWGKKAFQMLHLQNQLCYKKQSERTYCNNSQRAVGCKHYESSWGKKAFQMLHLQNCFCFKKKTEWAYCYDSQWE